MQRSLWRWLFVACSVTRITFPSLFPRGIMRLFVFVALVCISLQIIYAILISLLYLLYSLSIPNLSATLMSYSISLLFGALKYRKFFHLILSLLLAILALYTFFYHYASKSRGFAYGPRASYSAYKRFSRL